MNSLLENRCFERVISYPMRCIGFIACIIFFGIEALIIYSLYHQLLPYYLAKPTYSTFALVITIPVISHDTIQRR